MNTTQTTWIIIIVVVVILVIVGLVVYFGRRRRLASHRTQAAELRQTAKNDELIAREVEAKAARAAADAKQSEVDAARSRQQADERQGEAEAVRTHSNDQARQADELDPDVDVRRPTAGANDASAAVDQTQTNGPSVADTRSSLEAETDRPDGASGAGSRPTSL